MMNNDLSKMLDKSWNDILDKRDGEISAIGEADCLYPIAGEIPFTQ